MKTILAIYGIQDRGKLKYPGYTHDHNICVMQDGRIIQYLHLERYTRRKYDNRLHLFIEALIDDGLLKLPKIFDVALVNSFVGRAFISSSGKIRIEPTEIQVVSNTAVPSIAWIQQHEWEGFAPKSCEVSHELAHVFSCLPFYGNLKENSLLIHFDGGASLGNFSAFSYKKGKLSLLECHWQLGHLSKLFNDNGLTFAMLKAAPGEHCSVAGKLMGYAAMGQASSKMRKWLKANKYFKDIWEDHNVFYKKAKADFKWTGKLENNKDQFLMNIAACFQAEFQEQALAKIQQLQKQTKADYLYYAGGCALSIITNSQLIEKDWFKDVFIPPCCNDSGLSIGAAAFVQWQAGQKIKRHSPYLNNINLKKKKLVYTQKTIHEIARRIMAGEVIGICNGYGEAGPRALGNRSLIARPDSVKLTKKVSMKCKKREWYRPVAPIMLERNAQKVTGKPDIHHLARYMLLDFKISDQYKKQLEGVVHKNGTARIQVLFNKKENPFMYDLLDFLDKKYGLLGLINTSFNKRGEPIVHTKAEATKSAQEMKLDSLVINGTLKKI